MLTRPIWILGRLSVLAAIACVIALLAPSSALADSKRLCNKDVSFSYQVCMNMNFTVITYRFNPAVAVSSYNVTWTALDSTVQVTNAKVVAGVNGFDTNGGSHFSQTQQWTVNGGFPTPGVTYTFVPSWAGLYIQMSGGSNGAYQVVGARSTLKRGGSSWTFNSYNVCSPYSDGRLIGGCDIVP
jgi:hypothetical protein